MKPGKELDALIADKVMGLELVLGDEKRITGALDVKYYVRPEYALKSGESVFHKQYIVCREDHLPKYSELIGPAWEVVAKLIKDNPIWFLEVHSNNCQNYCKIWKNDGNKNYGWIAEEYGLSASHAICLAALKAVRFDL